MAPSEVLIRKLQRISSLREPDLAVLRGIPIHEKEFQANQDLVLEGDRPSHSFVLVDGLVGSTKYTGDGKRQITSFFVTGDIPDLHGLHLPVMDCTFSTLTPSRVGFMRHDSLRAICDQHPRIAAAFWRSTLIDAAIYREWVTNVGRRDAFTRIAHILCELIYRLRAVGRIDDHIADIPITQAALGDAVGLSTVHVNRTLQELRHKGLIETSGAQTRVQNWPNLVRAGDFNPTYLHNRDPEVVV
ncbi:Crp/Fnr family transcriptional regulator [Mesorhizobium sp. ES1-1]|uniref:Crp/Fnr family transcriptional regulator n=1 Tax=Mesorhizobium sp. ES1-1 TaxID=2876629 RepID=UPI001CD020B3|nr:Crp/Fnr family transcriptional regulator [Mesorhizobium sp. ES1-1]MBZ9678274.1 Crp/Fnr family transcriptional regulator [Mesorhizobium sp. ES1-1]